MEIKETYLKNEGVIQIEYVGVYPTESFDTKELFGIFYKAIEKHDTKKVILDFTQMKYNQTALKISLIPEELKAEGLDNKTTAIVCEKDSETAEKFRLTVASTETQVFLGKLNTKVKLFFEMDTALDWLKNVSN